MNTQTCHHADFSDAELLGSGVQTLNDDVAEYARDWTGDADLDDVDADMRCATDCVRVRVDCRTSRWKSIQKSDLEVIQTVRCSSAKQSVFSNRAFQNGGRPPSWIFEIRIFDRLRWLIVSFCITKPNFAKIPLPEFLLRCNSYTFIVLQLVWIPTPSAPSTVCQYIVREKKRNHFSFITGAWNNQPLCLWLAKCSSFGEVTDKVVDLILKLMHETRSTIITVFAVGNG